MFCPIRCTQPVVYTVRALLVFEIFWTPPPCHRYRPQPNLTTRRWTRTVPVSRKTTVTVPIIILNYYLLFSKTRTRLLETCRRALLSIVVCWLHWCWAETLPTPPVMTLSPVSRRRCRSPGPVSAADTNTQCADRTIATDELVFWTGCLALRPADYATTVHPLRI